MLIAVRQLRLFVFIVAIAAFGLAASALAAENCSQADVGAIIAEHARAQSEAGALMRRQRELDCARITGVPDHPALQECRDLPARIEAALGRAKQLETSAHRQRQSAAACSRAAPSERSPSDICLFDVCLGQPISHPRCIGNAIPASGCWQQRASGNAAVVFEVGSKPEMLVADGLGLYATISATLDEQQRVEQIGLRALVRQRTVDDFIAKFGKAEQERTPEGTTWYRWKLASAHLSMQCLTGYGAVCIVKATSRPAEERERARPSKGPKL